MLQSSPALSTAPVSVQIAMTTERHQTNPIGVAALALGIISILIAWVPFLGLIAIPIGLLGVLLGAIGIIHGLITKRGKLTTSGVGLALSIGSITLSIFMTGFLVHGVESQLNKAQAKVAQSALPAPVAKPRDKPDSIPPQPVAAQSDPTEIWLAPDQPGVLGKVQVRIQAVIVGRVPLLHRFAVSDEDNKGSSAESLTSILIEVTNLDPNRKLDFKTLAGARMSFQHDSATLRDNCRKRISWHKLWF